MTPLALFLLGCTTVFLGVVQAAFSALMRLSLRLMAERGGRDDRLGHYLDDPLHLFVPVRILLGEKNPDLRPGMMVEVYIALRDN